MSVNIGQTVEYVSTKGLSKVALVVATPDTLKEGTSLATAHPLDAEQEQVNLAVFSASGKSSARLQVPSEAAVAENENFANGGFYRVIA